MVEDVYCIDSSSLMELSRQYPKSSFPTLWVKIDTLIEAGRLISPEEVLNEIKRGDDSLVEWAKKRRQMFIPLDSDQARIAGQILASSKDLIDPLGEAPQADPFLIALAKVRNDSTEKQLFDRKHVVVTQEGRHKPNKIPQVATRFGVESIRLLDLFEKENWKF